MTAPISGNLGEIAIDAFTTASYRRPLRTVRPTDTTFSASILIGPGMRISLAVAWTAARTHRTAALIAWQDGSKVADAQLNSFSVLQCCSSRQLSPISIKLLDLNQYHISAAVRLYLRACYSGEGGLPEQVCDLGMGNVAMRA